MTKMKAFHIRAYFNPTNEIKGAKRDVHGVLLLSERGFVSVQRRGHDGLLAAHGSGRERRVLQIKCVLLGPQIKKLGQDLHTKKERIYSL